MPRVLEMGPSGEMVEVQQKSTAVTFWGSSPVVLESYAGAWQQDVTLAPANLLAFAAVYSCVSLIANDVAKLRPKLMKLASDGVWDEVSTGSSAFIPVLRKPNRYQTRIQFMVQWLTWKLLHGNAYVLKERDERGVVTALYPVDPRCVKPLVAPDGEVFYQLGADELTGVTEANDSLITTGDGYRRFVVPSSEIVHDRMVTLWHPLCGVSPIYACGSSATQGARIQANSEAFFRNMSRPSGILMAPGKITPEKAVELKAAFEAAHSGTNLGRLFMMSDGLRYEPVPPIPAHDAQLIEQLKWTVEDVARAFGVPLYKIQAGANPTFNNIGALNQEYYGQCLQQHIEAVELLLDEGLGLPRLGMGVELDLDGLLRMDPLTRADTYHKLVTGGVMSPNEARTREGYHGVAGGESPYLQQQNYSLAALAKRDAQADPFRSPT